MAKSDTQIKVQGILEPKDLGLPESVNAASSQEYGIWIRGLLQNGRQGTVKVKGRSDVSLSNRKPFKQKGTGRARAGSARSPLWRGGGVIFGPQPRTRTLSWTKQLKQRVLLSMIHELCTQKRFVSFAWDTTHSEPKTSAAFAILKNMELDRSPVLLCVTKENEIVARSFMNIPSVRIVLFDQLNAHNLSWADYVLVLKDDIAQLHEMVAQWI